ncbi:MAG: CmcI family methyltransferase [Bryobacteraceae bacterium]
MAVLLLASCGSSPPAQRAPKPRFKAVDLGHSVLAVAEERARPRLLRGFGDANGGWRPVEPIFAVRLDKPPLEVKELYVELEFAIPREIDFKNGDVTVTAKVNGVEACRNRFPDPNSYKMTCRVPEQALARPQLEVEFHADRSYSEEGTGRKTALRVVSVRVCELEGTYAFQKAQVVKARRGYEALARRWKGASVEETREALSLYHKTAVWRSAWFAGVQILQNPLDLWTMQEIIVETRPEFIVETGTLEGGSALYLASVLDAAGLGDSKIITVDIMTTHRAAEANPLWGRYVEFIHASSTDPVVVERIATRVRGRRTMVTLDSDHSMLHVLRELRLYAPLVSPGGYLVVEDTNMDGVPSYPGDYTGPMAAVERFLEQGGAKDFERDLNREPFLMTFHPGGWLKRRQ